MNKRNTQQRRHSIINLLNQQGEVSVEELSLRFETSEVTTHEKPTYINHDVIHYCVPNIPSTAPRKASILLSNSIVDYVKALSTNNLHLYPELLKDNL